MAENVNPDTPPTQPAGRDSMLWAWENGGDVDMSAPSDAVSDRERRDATRFISVRDLMRMEESLRVR